MLIASPTIDTASGGRSLNARLTRRAVLVCIATTAAVAALELSLGAVFNLVSVFAEGLHTAADLADSIVALVLVSIALRPADPTHPYGHGKFDSFAGVIEGLCVAGSGLWAVHTSIRILGGWAPAEARPDMLAVAAMAVTSLAYLVISFYVRQIARRTGSAAVYAEGMHLMTHIYVTGGLFVGLVLSRIAEAASWPVAEHIDPTMAALLGAFLVLTGLRVVWVAAVQLSDAALPADERAQVIACLREFEREFVEVHALRTRRAGSERHIDVHLVLAGDATVSDSHDLAHRIEARLGEVLHDVRLLVHVEPATAAMNAACEARAGVGAVMIDDLGASDYEAQHHTAATAHRR
jgi:cation diffusion facilitator family transporter